ncbi:uncharacterized protein EAF02_003468 [Botrytis sinoallii]|uniref:uncharacterized protein n=1 Tax=Botrytis sinoallii TaxID=1463999 RepID=UPI001901301C|nr:uncharacterized protein EAF02_003468 [Botrytis sinoallii]KAF7886821.1 hypothetical protein EAF02_003468 [Botrytis sinoallii]
MEYARPTLLIVCDQIADVFRQGGMRLYWAISCAASSYFAIWLKSEKFSVTLRNVIPSGASLISAFCVILWGFGANYSGSRFAFVIGPLTYGLIPNGILAIWPKSVKLKEFAFLTDGVQIMTAVFYAWANEICAGDSEERAIVISSMNGLQYAVAGWLPIVIFPQTEAPTFRRGFPATFGFVITALLAILLIQFLHTRELKQTAEMNHEDTEAINSEEVLHIDSGPTKGIESGEFRGVPVADLVCPDRMRWETEGVDWRNALDAVKKMWSRRCIKSSKTKNDCTLAVYTIRICGGGGDSVVSLVAQLVRIYCYPETKTRLDFNEILTLRVYLRFTRPESFVE